MTWLQGGPFLEISFLLTLDSDRQSFADNILTKLKTVTPTVEFAISERDLSEKINKFNIGYRYDDQDPNSILLHSAEIPVYVKTDEKRKSILSMRQISDRLVAIDFWFFGSELDAPEWNQKGITKNQMPIFKNLLHRLLDTFDFIVGTVGYEVSVTDLFDTKKSWPDEQYNLDNIDNRLVQGDNYFTLIIDNKKTST
ncbi:MAG: hypothetical protein IM602_17905 [Cytophagales bacterium]|nr:hypothetical protein [Cytophagales bacterium]MCA6427520.1 hypothetical protein [Cytophagales bacterium]